MASGSPDNPRAGFKPAYGGTLLLPLRDKRIPADSVRTARPRKIPESTLDEPGITFYRQTRGSQRLPLEPPKEDDTLAEVNLAVLLRRGSGTTAAPPQRRPVVTLLVVSIAVVTASIGWLTLA